MKLSGKNWTDTLAGEYLLGTLTAGARRQLERELTRDRALREAVDRWERKFQPLLTAIPPERPPRRVWQAIQSALGEAERESPWWQRLTFWRPLALASSALALVLVLYLGFVKRVEVPTGQFFAYLNDPGVEPAFAIRLDSEKALLRVQALKPPPLSADQALELWMLPGEGKSPVSLGLLPSTGEKGIALAPDKMKVLLSATGLAVSLEPKGGSPTGLPTGPVLYQGKLQSLSS